MKGEQRGGDAGEQEYRSRGEEAGSKELEKHREPIERAGALRLDKIAGRDRSPGDGLGSVEEHSLVDRAGQHPHKRKKIDCEKQRESRIEKSLAECRVMAECFPGGWGARCDGGHQEQSGRRAKRISLE